MASNVFSNHHYHILENPDVDQLLVNQYNISSDGTNVINLIQDLLFTISNIISGIAVVSHNSLENDFTTWEIKTDEHQPIVTLQYKLMGKKSIQPHDLVIVNIQNEDDECKEELKKNEQTVLMNEIKQEKLPSESLCDRMNTKKAFLLEVQNRNNDMTTNDCHQPLHATDSIYGYCMNQEIINNEKEINVHIPIKTEIPEMLKLLPSVSAVKSNYILPNDHYEITTNVDQESSNECNNSELITHSFSSEELQEFPSLQKKTFNRRTTDDLKRIGTYSKGRIPNKIHGSGPISESLLDDRNQNVVNSYIANSSALFTNSHNIQCHDRMLGSSEWFISKELQRVGKSQTQCVQSSGEKGKSQNKERKWKKSPEATLRNREATRLRMRRIRSCLSAEELARRREVERERRKKNKKPFNAEEAARRREAERLRRQRRRSEMNEEEASRSREIERLRKRRLRSQMSEEKLSRIREIERLRMRMRRSQLSKEEKNAVSNTSNTSQEIT